MHLKFIELCVSSGEKENSLKTDDYGRDLSSVQTLLTKQVHTGPGNIGEATVRVGAGGQCPLILSFL